MSESNIQEVQDENHREFFFCPPDFLELKYVINPWMKLENEFSCDKAKEQWRKLVDLYHKLVPTHVHEVPAKKNLTELCFFGDSVFYFKGKAIFGNFKNQERAQETDYVIKYCNSVGIQGIRVPEDIFYEGSGETLVWNGKILVGYGMRSGSQIIEFLQKEFPDNEVIGIELVDPEFYHLDTCLFPVSNNLIAVYENALSEQTKQKIKSLGCEILYLSYQDAKQFAFNSVAIGDQIIIHHEAKNFIQILKNRGFKVHTVDVSEFIKFGGGLKCLTFQCWN